MAYISSLLLARPSSIHGEQANFHANTLAGIDFGIAALSCKDLTMTAKR